MLNKKTQYAFQALIYLVEHKDDGPVLIAEIAKEKNIPLKFLENILLELRKMDILESKKGKGGGYFIKKKAIKTPLATIIRKIEGPIAMLPCASLYFYERCKNCDEKHCGLHDTMILVRDSTLKILERKTIADLVEKK